MQENRHCVQFFQDLISSIQSACLKHIYCSVSVEVSGYLAIEIDSTRKERYVISELVHAGGGVISESFCSKAFSATPPSSVVSRPVASHGHVVRTTASPPRKFSISPPPPLPPRSSARTSLSSSRRPNSRSSPADARTILPSEQRRSRSPLGDQAVCVKSEPSDESCRFQKEWTLYEVAVEKNSVSNDTATVGPDDNGTPNGAGSYSSSIESERGGVHEHVHQSSASDDSTRTRLLSTDSGAHGFVDPNLSNDAVPVGGPWSVTAGTGTQRKRAAEPGQTSAQPKKGKQLQVKQEAEDTNYRRAATASEEDIVVVPVTGAESDEDICVLEASGSFVSADDDDDDCVIFAESTVPVRQQPQQHQQHGNASLQQWAAQQGLGNFTPGRPDPETSKHTVRKTRAHVQLFHRYLQASGDNRPMESIQPNELDPLLGSFLTEVRKEDGEEYEPVYLKNIQSSLERYLRYRGYSWSITRDSAFAGSRAKLKTKQDLLVEQGKGQGIPRFDMLTPQDVDTFYACGQLGTSSADSLINTLWFLLSIRFGFRMVREHSEMVWGDLHLQQDSEGQEQLVFTGMSGLTPVFRRAVTAEPNNTQRCLVAVYKRYRELRPPSILNPESPFYLAVNHPYGQDADRCPWFRTTACGSTRLANVVRRMAEACGMGQRRLTNSSIHSIINFRNNL
ncbi:hypothetical protein BaRGS_00035412 [Batillaria attramentaria]|uniref:ZMYM2-like/QRICH1 C-terminal domain-containing protein n=1 Tax=Batillaria attramentaria TaxID=370345 RepID=A0ABD0JE75_9CAEN